MSAEAIQNISHMSLLGKFVQPSHSTKVMENQYRTINTIVDGCSTIRRLQDEAGAYEWHVTFRPGQDVGEVCRIGYHLHSFVGEAVIFIVNGAVFRIDEPKAAAARSRV